MNNVSNATQKPSIVCWSIGFCLLILSLAIFIGQPSQALATTYRAHIVDSYDKAPMTEGYLDHMRGRKPDSFEIASQVFTKSAGNEREFLIRDASYVPPDNPKTIANAVTLTYKNAGTTVKGRSLDLKVTMDVTWCHTSQDDSGYYPCFLSVPYKDYYLHLRASMGYADRPGGPEGPTHRNGVSTRVRYTITYSDTQELCKEKILIWVHDLDQSTIGPFANEALTLNAGFSPDLYILRNSKLNSTDLVQGYLHSAQGADEGPLTSFVGYIQGGVCDFTWQGESCSTVIGAIYPGTYPELEDDPVYAPSKVIETINGETPASDNPYVLQGQTITFMIHQKLPYVVEANKPVMTQLIDELDDCLDAQSAKVTVVRQGQDVTTNWKMSIEGQRLILTAQDTSQATLDLEFRITVPVKRDAILGSHSNVSHTRITTRTQKDIDLVSNTVEWRVGAVPKTLQVTKVLQATDLNGYHGAAIFPFELKVVGKDGQQCLLHRVAVLSGEEVPSKEGIISAQALFDLDQSTIANPVALELRELPTSRFSLFELTSSDSCATKNGALLMWDLDPSKVEGQSLSCVARNKKVEHRWLSHSVVAINTILSE